MKGRRECKKEKKRTDVRVREKENEGEKERNEEAKYRSRKIVTNYNETGGRSSQTQD